MSIAVEFKRVVSSINPERFLPALLCISGGLLLAGLMIPTYHNEQEFLRRYSELGSGQTKEYLTLRNEFLTSSITFQNYGMTAFLLAVFLFATARWMKIIACTSKSLMTVALAGVVAILSTGFALIGSLFLDYHRGEFPHWADSLGIPLSGIPFVLLPMTCWASINMCMIAHSRRLGRIGDIWLNGVMLITLLVMILTVAAGDFWMLMAAMCWLVFYLSIQERRKLLVKANRVQ